MSGCSPCWSTSLRYTFIGQPAVWCGNISKIETVTKVLHPVLTWRPTMPTSKRPQYLCCTHGSLRLREGHDGGATLTQTAAHGLMDGVQQPLAREGHPKLLRRIALTHQTST